MIRNDGRIGNVCCRAAHKSTPAVGLAAGCSVDLPRAPNALRLDPHGLGRSTGRRNHNRRRHAEESLWPLAVVAVRLERRPQFAYELRKRLVSQSIQQSGFTHRLWMPTSETRSSIPADVLI